MALELGAGRVGAAAGPEPHVVAVTHLRRLDQQPVGAEVGGELRRQSGPVLRRWCGGIQGEQRSRGRRVGAADENGMPFVQADLQGVAVASQDHQART